MARTTLRAIWDNRFFDAATLTPSSQVATLPAVNLQDCQRQRVWRTTGLANQYLTIDLGTPGDPEDVRPAVTALALINHNLTRTAEVTLQASLSPDFSNPLVNQTFPAWGDIIGAGEGGAGGPFLVGGALADCQRPYYAPNPVRIIYLTGEPLEAKGYWRLSFSDPANPDGYVELGRLFLTFYDDYKCDFAYPWDFSGVDESTVEYSRGGQPWTDRRPLRRSLRFGWNSRFADEDKYWRLFFMLSKVGIVQDWLIDPRPNGVAERFFTSLYGRFDPNQQLPLFSQHCKGLSDVEFYFLESL